MPGASNRANLGMCISYHITFIMSSYLFSYDRPPFFAFIDLLKDIVDMWNARIAADANLSRCMRHINGVYTQRFNRAHASDGLLFRGGRASGMEEREA